MGAPDYAVWMRCQAQASERRRLAERRIIWIGTALVSLAHAAPWLVGLPG